MTLPWLVEKRPRQSAMRLSALSHWLGLVALFATTTMSVPVHADELPEYRLKAAFLYNFIMFTEWPASTGNTLSVCVSGNDPFGAELDALQGKVAGARTLAVQRKAGGDSLKGCQVVFIAPSAIESLPRLLAGLRGQPTLTIADSPGALHQGVVLNLAVQNSRVSFQASVPAARSAGLILSSKLLRLATEVEQ